MFTPNYTLLKHWCPFKSKHHMMHISLKVLCTHILRVGKRAEGYHLLHKHLDFWGGMSKTLFPPPPNPRMVVNEKPLYMSFIHGGIYFSSLFIYFGGQGSTTWRWFRVTFTYKMASQGEKKRSCWGSMHGAPHVELAFDLACIYTKQFHSPILDSFPWPSLVRKLSYATLGCKSPRLASIFIFSNFYQLDLHNEMGHVLH